MAQPPGMVPPGYGYMPGPKSEAIAILLSIFLLGGAGQIYVGKIGRGITFMILTVVGLFFFAIPGLIAYIWGIVDAFQQAQNYNRFLMQYSRPPTSMDMW